MSDLPAQDRVLYECRLVLASDCRIVRVREATPEQAIATVGATYPGWTVLTVHQWAGEGWVPAA
ncbi:MAG TPA: hypothetical protein VJ301_18865 [Propionibacteriaceae bacterium]|nr:hypothetical protein [Propionibacteriaceae bacterium]